MKRQIIYIAAAFLFSGVVTAQKLDLNAMPKPGPSPTINIAQPKTFQLKNGLTVMVVENHKLPRVNVSLSMDRPPVKEGEIVGISSVFSDLMGTGTKTLAKDEFNKKVDYLGARLSFFSSGASANTLSKYFPKVMELMSDAIMNPVFTEDEVQKSKERQIEGLKTEEKSADKIAQNVGNALVYGKNTSRGEFETQESISKIQLKDVEDFYNKYYAPDRAYLVVVGDVNFKEVKKQVEKLFKDWKKSGTTYSALEPATNLPKTEINIVDVPTAVQSVIHVGNLSPVQMKDAAYFPATIATYILGGGGDARLFMNLREKNAFTYGAYASLSTQKYNQEFQAEASVRNEVTSKAVTEFMNELKGMSTIKPEELANAKAKLKGSFIMSLERPETVAKFALNLKTQDLPKDFYTNYLKSIDAITTADVVNAAQKVILPNQARIFVAGKSSDIADDLEKLGFPVKYYDKDANPVEKTTAKKVDASISVASVLDQYIKAIGGKAALEKVNSISMLASTTVQGVELNMKSIEAKGGKKFIDVTMMGNSVQKLKFDGKDGAMEAGGQKMQMTEEMKKDFLGNKEVFPELAVNQSELSVAGIEKFNNEDCYAIKAKNATSYYSVKTGLKAGEVKTAMGQSVPVTYSDYKDVNGVKLPYKFSQQAGGMTMDFTVKSYELNKATDSDFK